MSTDSIPNKNVKELTPKALDELLKSNKNIQLIDVREPWESEKCTIGGELIPVGHVGLSLNRFSKDKQVIVYCRSGVRSASAIKLVEYELGLSNLYNLKGGILAWSDEVDSSIEKY